MRDVMQRWVLGALKEVFEGLQAKANKASDNATLVDMIEALHRDGDEPKIQVPFDEPKMRKAA